MMLRAPSDRSRAVLVPSVVVLFGIAISACVSDGGGANTSDGGVPAPPECTPRDAKLEADASPLRLNELMSDNDGAAVDELGETDDFIELYNTGARAIELSTHVLRDESGRVVRLPRKLLAAHESVLLWADDDVEQGPMHLPLKLDADGERVELWTDDCKLVDRVDVPALPLSESFARVPDGDGAFEVCRYASAGRPNGDRCAPPAPPELPEDATFERFDWPKPWPAFDGPLLVTELALRPAKFVEVQNIGDTDLSLADYALRIAPSAPGVDWPGPDAGIALTWPVDDLAPGERTVVEVPADATAALEADPAFEGVVSVFDADGKNIDRRDFMHWPMNAVLARVNDVGAPAFCTNATPGESTKRCDEVAMREVGDRVRALQTPGDFAALAAGGVEVGQLAVKFVVDMQAGDTVHLLGSEKWPLHYTFIREQIDHEPALDRCDPEQSRQFDAGWYAFSQTQYFVAKGRRYLLGTLVRYASGLQTVEYTQGDAIDPEQMKRGFFAVMRRVPDPRAWSLRPGDAHQLSFMRQIEGSVPIVSTNAPFIGVDYQPLTQAVGYGTLRFVPSAELASAEIGPHVIVVTDDVPNGIPLVGGLVTEAFQTPLAHVNVLSQARGTPNMALRGAHADPRFKPLFGKLVRLEVGPADVTLQAASADEADKFWRAHAPTGDPVVPPLDDSVRGMVALPGRGLEDLPAVGAKAAQLAELYRVSKLRPNQGCPVDTVPLHVPRDAFAVPVAYYLDHFEASGARTKLKALLEDADFRADPDAHERGLDAVRQKILEYPVDEALLKQVTDAVAERFGEARVRFRSSSNTEDLPSFNGAGLHTSTSVELGDPDRGVADGLRTVWSSLWNTRAFDERELGHIDQLGAAMGVLVHLAEQGEAAQGVGISRDMLDLSRMDIFYINAQIGEASVTNPAPAVVTEQLLYTLPPRTPLVSYQTMSSLTGGGAVLDFDEVQRIGCALGAVHEHFRPLLDPDHADHLFAMQIEWKLLRDGTLLVKQARPQPFGSVALPADCREF